eukprot:c17637_g1_i2.p1 GENE.c17637_g1_i2~~c17637_g1_i2.p1  ORF type:complete len:188 (+),score=46.06 c17637_g1_i2:460-1023(+)
MMAMQTILAPIFNQSNNEAVKIWREWAPNVLGRYIVLCLNASITDIPANIRYIASREELSKSLKAKYIGAGAGMYMVAHLSTKNRLQKAVGHEVKDVRAELHQQLRTWCSVENLPPSAGPFHGGNNPDLADTDVFGMISSVRGHPLFDEMKQGPCKRWMQAMDDFIYVHKDRNTGPVPYSQIAKTSK